MANEQKTYDLLVQPRQSPGKDSKKLRREHIVPGVVYGHRVDPQSVQVDQKELERVYLRAGSTSLIDLRTAEGEKPRKVFIHEVQRDPKTHNLLHVDFLAVNLREELTTTVPLVLTGEAPAVKAGDGLLLHPLDHVQVRALPTNIPPLLEVDVSDLDEVDKSLYISDLSVPDGVTVLNSAEELVAKVTALPTLPEEAEEAAEEAEEAAEEGEEAATEEGESEDKDEES